MSKSKNPTYHRWYNMMSRCYKKHHPQYKDYGGRGIDVCLNWHSFDVFEKEVGLPPESGLSLDRIDNNKGYYPDNIRWASYKQQSNNKRDVKRYTYCGVSLSASEWEDVFEFKKWRLQSQSEERILMTISGKCNRGRIYVFHDDKYLSLKEWSIELKIPYSTLTRRLRKYGHNNPEKVLKTAISTHKDYHRR